MIAASQRDRVAGKLLVASADGQIQHLNRSEIASLFERGDVVVANDAATFPASVNGVHEPTGEHMEIRLASFVEAGDPSRFVAVAFGEGDYHTPTEHRPPPPQLSPRDRLRLGPLVAVIDRLLGHDRLVELSFVGDVPAILAGLARHGRPIQYAHVPEQVALWDVWTSLAAKPFAFEAPSAGFALDWRTLGTWRRRGVEVVTLTHAAGISSTGDAVLDERLPLDEPFIIPELTASAVARAKESNTRVIAIGTTVVRALEAAADSQGRVRPGSGVARGRIGPETQLNVVDTILSGVHEPSESHFQLLRAFTDDTVLERIHLTAVKRHYRTHEFGDSVLIERRQPRSATQGAVLDARGPEHLPRSVELTPECYVAFVQHPDNAKDIEFGVSHADGPGGGVRGCPGPAQSRGVRRHRKHPR